MEITLFTTTTDKKIAYVLNQFVLFTSLDITFNIRTGTAPHTEEKCIWYVESPNSASGKIHGIICHRALHKQIDISDRLTTSYNDRSFFFYRSLGQSDKPAIISRSADIYICFDIIAQIFHHLTCGHEVDLEMDGQTISSNVSAITNRADIFDTPNVNHIFLVFEDMLSRVFGAQKKSGARYPKGAQFCVALSHDVDSPRKGMPERIKHGIHGMRKIIHCATKKTYSRIPSECMTTLRKIFGNAPYNKLDYIARIESEKNVRSSFNIYVKCNGNNHTYAERIHNPHYDILSDNTMRTQLRALIPQGFEIGLHGSYCLHHDRSPLNDEKRALEDALECTITGGRQHFLNYSAMHTPAIFSNAGFLYDTTVGFRDRNAFRACAALPYFLYDVKTDNALNVLEIPLVLMDGVLFDRLHHTAASAWTAIEMLMTQIKDAHGACSVVWHQRVFDNPDYPEWEEVYARLVYWISSNHGICVTPGELNDFWRNKIREDGNLNSEISCVTR